MLIKRENDGVDLIFFCVKRSVSARQLEKITVKKAEAKVVKCTEKQILDP